MPWPRWAREPVVEEEGRAGLPGLLLAAHHQLAHLGRAAPVDAAQLVAAAVLAHGDVLGRAGGERAWPVVSRAGPRAAQRDLGQRHRAGRDRQRDRGVEGAAELDQPEGVADAHAHRSDLELAAHVGAHLVGRVAAPPLTDAVEHEAGAGAEHVGHVVLEQQRTAGRLALVGERQVEPGRLAGDDDLRRERAHQREPVAAAAQHVRRHQRQRQHQHADAGEGVLAEEDGADDGRDARGEERPPADGQAGQRLTHASPHAPGLITGPSGTGTVATMPSRMAPVLRPLIDASTLGSRRWASTWRARTRRSSGST